MIAALVGVPAAAGIVAHSGGTPPTPPNPLTGTAVSARVRAQPFLQLIGTPVRSCRFEGPGHTSILCTLEPKGECEIELSTGRAECDLPGKGTTDYLILSASRP